MEPKSDPLSPSTRCCGVNVHSESLRTGAH